MRHFRRHADALSQRGVGVDGFTDVYGVCAHLNRECNLANHVARVGAHNTAPQNAAMTMRFFGIIKQEFGEAFVSAIGDGPA